MGNLAAEKESLAVQQQSLAAEKEQLAIEKTRLKAEQKRIAALEKDVEAKANPPKERTVAIVSTSTHGPYRFVRFTLENGEIWQQNESAYVRLGRGEPDMLVLKRSNFGATTGKVNGKAPIIHLKKIG